MKIAKTPKPPYYAVIFTSILAENSEEYQQTSIEMEELAKTYDGFLGFESAREKVGVFVSYWKDLDAIKKWSADSRHQKAKEKGINQWYKNYHIRIAKVERDYCMQ